MGLKILYKDNNFVVVDKAPDTVINSNDSNRESLQKQLCLQFPEAINQSLKFGFYFPHRLDYSTSGVMCIALTKKACAAASTTFQHRTSRKYYLALLRGHVSQPALEIDIPVGEETPSKENDANGNPPRKMSAQSSQLRSSITRLIVLDRGLYASYPATKVLLAPLTGRRHQLRLHCHLLGHTIVGDYTYSNRKDVEPPRMFLHSFRLVLPTTATMLDLTTEDPFLPATLENWTPVESLTTLDSYVMDQMLQDDFHPIVTSL